ncbi:MAG: hypothetical protein EOP84_08665 [Verrucomicrobiaceae bacterium]|nr:MAG: hypothetical protein EOP84_08665 [Verrucomicrobiaceae bacterium]
MKRSTLLVLLMMAALLGALFMLSQITPSFQASSSATFESTSANPPEQMFEHIIQSPIPPGITAIQGAGDTWQGYSIYLRFHASPNFLTSFLQSGWRRSEWPRVERRFRLPSGKYDQFAPPWSPASSSKKECYEGEFSNSWGTGTHYLLLDRATGLIHFYGVAA